MLEGFGGAKGIVLGAVLNIVWPTNLIGRFGSDADSVPQYQAIGCALQASVNLAVLQSTINAIDSDMDLAKGHIGDFLKFVDQGDVGGQQTALNQALSNVQSAKSAALQVLDGASALDETALLPSFVSIAYAELGIMREIYLGGFSYSGGRNGYDVVAQTDLECAYVRYMDAFETMWNTLVADRKSKISVVTSSQGSANLISITDAYSGFSVTAGGAFCTGTDCTGGGYPTAGLSNIGTGTEDAVYNEALAMFRLAMEPISYLHLLVPRYATLPARQPPSWLPGSFVLGPYSINPTSDHATLARIGLTLTDANTDSGSGGPYTSTTDSAFAFPNQIVTWSNDGSGTGVELDYCPNDIQYGLHINSVAEDSALGKVKLPVSDANTLKFLSGLTTHISSTNMYDGESGNKNIGVTFTSIALLVTSIDRQSGNATVESIAAPDVGTPFQGNVVSSGLNVNLTSSSPYWLMTSLSQIGGVYPLLHQSLGPCALCNRITGTFGFQATFTFFEDAIREHPCPGDPVDEEKTLLSVPYERFSAWNDRLLGALHLQSGSQFDNVNQTLIAVYNRGINTVYTDMMQTLPVLVDRQFLNESLFSPDANICTTAVPFTDLYVSLSAVYVNASYYMSTNDVSYLTSAIAAANGALSAMENAPASNNFQFAPWYVPTGQLYLALLRENSEFFSATTQPAIGSEVTRLTGVLAGLVSGWKNWRLPQVTSSSTSSSFTVTDAWTATVVTDSVDQAVVSHYADGTLQAMQNELTAFMAAVTSPASLWPVFAGQVPDPTPVSVNVGPYGRSPSGALVGYSDPNRLLSDPLNLPITGARVTAAAANLTGTSLWNLRASYSNGQTASYIIPSLGASTPESTNPAFTVPLVSVEAAFAPGSDLSLLQLRSPGAGGRVAVMGSGTPTANLTMGGGLFAPGGMSTFLNPSSSAVMGVASAFVPLSSGAVPVPPALDAETAHPFCFNVHGRLCGSLGLSPCCPGLDCRRHVQSGECGDGPDQEEQLGRKEQQALALTALDGLSLDDKLALLVTYVDGLPGPAAAEVLDISFAAFRQRLSRARHALRKRLDVLLQSGAPGDAEVMRQWQALLDPKPRSPRYNPQGARTRDDRD